MAAEIVLRALKHLWLSLAPLHLPMALMGGMSLAVWKHVRLTQDVDILVGLGQFAADGVLNRLEKAGFRPKRQPPIQQLGPLRVLQLLYEPPQAFLETQVDLLFADSEYHRQALARSSPARLEGLDIEIAVLSCEDLILHKLVAGRIIDKADTANLLRINRSILDLNYLLGWISRLSLTSEWSEVWQEAFPGEPAPFAQ
jgi:hypothetical protein